MASMHNSPPCVPLKGSTQGQGTVSEGIFRVQERGGYG